MCVGEENKTYYKRRFVEKGYESVINVVVVVVYFTIVFILIDIIVIFSRLFFPTYFY